MLEYVNPEYLEDLARRVRAGDDLTEADRLALSDAVDQLDRLSRKAAIALRDQLIRAYCEKWHGRLFGARREKAFLQDVLDYRCSSRWMRAKHKATNPHPPEMRAHDIWEILTAAPDHSLPRTRQGIAKILN